MQHLWSLAITYSQTSNTLGMINRGYVSIHVLSPMKLHDLSDEISSTYGSSLHTKAHCTTY